MSTTLKQFKELVKKINYESQSLYSFDEEDIDDTYLIIDKVYTGGMVGGSCWGGVPEYEPTYESTTPNFKVLETIITENFPDTQLTIRNFFTIFNLISTQSESKLEYYGNRSDYTIYKINVESLYTLLTN